MFLYAKHRSKLGLGIGWVVDMMFQVTITLIRLKPGHAARKTKNAIP